MRHALLVLLSILASVVTLPSAAAVPCTWREVYVEGVDVDVCTSDESGRPTIVMVKHKSYGGASVSDTESDLWGEKWRFTDVLVWTYWRTPLVGQSATWVGFWCLDYEPDGKCNWFAAGASAQALGTGAAVYLRNTDFDGWSVCTGSVVRCTYVWDGEMPYVPYLP